MTVPQAPSVGTLLVEDDLGDVMLIREVFSELLPYRLIVVGDGIAALAYLRRKHPYEGRRSRI